MPLPQVVARFLLRHSPSNHPCKPTVAHVNQVLPLLESRALGSICHHRAVQGVGVVADEYPTGLLWSETATRLQDATLIVLSGRGGILSLPRPSEAKARFG